MSLNQPIDKLMSSLKTLNYNLAYSVDEVNLMTCQNKNRPNIYMTF